MGEGVVERVKGKKKGKAGRQERKEVTDMEEREMVGVGSRRRHAGKEACTRRSAMQAWE